MYINCKCLCVCVCVWIGDYRSPTGDDYRFMYSYRYKIKKCLEIVYSIFILICLLQTKCCLTQFVKYLRHQTKNEIDCNNSRKIRLFSRYLHSRFISRVFLSLESAPFQYFISHRDNSVHIFLNGLYMCNYRQEMKSSLGLFQS